MSQWSKHEDDFYFDSNPNYSTLNPHDEFSCFLRPTVLNNTIFNILHFNIQSMRSHFDELYLMLLNVFDFIDVLILTEIWIKDNEISFYNLDKFDMFYSCRDYNKSGGVVVYTNKKYDF